MYEKLGVTENHLQVLCLFTSGFDREYYVREVQKLLNISPRTAQLALGDLEKKTVLESRTRGKIRAYKIKKSGIGKQYLVFAEQYKRISFLEANGVVREIVLKIAPHIMGIAFIFGSFAKRTQKKESDLDIFVAGDYDKDEIDRVSGIYGVKISIKAYPLHIFKRELRKDALIKEVIGNHVIIKGTDEAVDVMADAYG